MDGEISSVLPRLTSGDLCTEPIVGLGASFDASCEEGTKQAILWGGRSHS